MTHYSEEFKAKMEKEQPHLCDSCKHQIKGMQNGCRAGIHELGLVWQCMNYEALSDKDLLCDTCKNHDRTESLCKAHYKCWQAKVKVGCDGYEYYGPSRQDIDEALADAGNTKSKQIGGDHYSRHKIQPWDAMESWMSKEQFTGFLLGSAIAYLGRFNATAEGKGGRQDIEKAKHYLEKLLEVTNA